MPGSPWKHQGPAPASVRAAGRESTAPLRASLWLSISSSEQSKAQAGSTQSSQMSHFWQGSFTYRPGEVSQREMLITHQPQPLGSNSFLQEPAGVIFPDILWAAQLQKVPVKAQWGEEQWGEGYVLSLNPREAPVLWSYTQASGCKQSFSGLKDKRTEARI